MLKKILPLVILPVLGLSHPAQAQQPYWWQAGNPYDAGPRYYDDGDASAEAQYGPDPYASQQDRFNEQQYRAYRREMMRRYRANAYGQDYPPPPRDAYGYDNNGDVPYAAPVYPVQPQSKSMAQVKPVVKKKQVIPAKPATATASTAATPATTGSTSAAPGTATASATPASNTAKKGGPVTCDKGLSIVSSFGFEKVASKSCAGTSLVYSAERGGKPFEIEVNPKSGELTAVKKL